MDFDAAVQVFASTLVGHHETRNSAESPERRRKRFLGGRKRRNRPVNCPFVYAPLAQRRGSEDTRRVGATADMSSTQTRAWTSLSPNRAPIARSVSLRSVRPRRRRGRTWRRSARRISSGGSRTRTRTSRCYRTSSCTTRRSPRPHPPPRTPPRARRAESSAIGAPPRAPPEARPPRAILLFGNSPSDFGAASCTPTAARRRWRTVPSARRRARRRRRSSLRRRPGRRAARAEARREKPPPRLRESVFFGSRRT